ncbi:MAG TPA: sigma-70 family RNA polymerase sigma factor [Pirellulales bacterium]|jgi:RNA polymerase sigma factor (sigma-70 family)|nr:sigma-70 family RNA polymerase sigma factor [Pirellulales bacterium]
MEPTDFELLQRFAADRDEDAFAELLRRHASMVRGACRRILSDPGESDDAVQSAFVELAGHAPTLARRPGWGNSVAGWLYRVAVNSALHAKRKARVRRRHEAAFARATHPRDMSDETAELLGVLHEELTALPAQFQAPLVLCHLQGMTQRQAAKELGLTYATVRRRLDGAKRQLHSRLARRGFAISAGTAAALWSWPAAKTASTTSGLPAATDQWAAPAGRLAQAHQVLVAKLAGLCSRVAAAGPLAKLTTAAAFVLVATVSLAAGHLARQTTQADGPPAIAAANRHISNLDGAATQDVSPQRDLQALDSHASRESDTVERFDGPAEPLDEADAAQASASPERMDVEMRTRFDFPEIPSGAGPLQRQVAMLQEARVAAGNDAGPKGDQPEPALDEPAAKRKQAGGQRREKIERAAKQNRKKSAEKRNRSNVVELYGIAWYASVERALAAAQGVVSDERDKPVFCLRVLGDLAGFM